MTVFILKLTTEEEVVGDISMTMNKDGQEIIVVKSPLKLTLMRDPSTGQPAKGFIDYILAQEVNEISFYKSQLICEPIEANKELSEVWTQQTSSLVLPSTGKIQLNG